MLGLDKWTRRQLQIDVSNGDLPWLKWQVMFNYFGLSCTEPGVKEFLEMVERAACGEDMAQAFVDVAEDFDLSLDELYNDMGAAVAKVLRASPDELYMWGLSHLRSKTVFGLAKRIAKIYFRGCYRESPVRMVRG